MNHRNDGYNWPTTEQELLLKATLLSGEASIEAWKKWAAAIDFNLLDSGSQRLLPLLYRNLAEQGVKHPAIDIYRGFYRMTWYKNQLLVHRLQKVLHLLQSRNIPVVLLKGSALALVYYKDWALRPMNDLDLLVPRENVLQAVDWLCENGWSANLRRPDEEDLKIRHAVTLVDESGMELDLHWRVILEWGTHPIKPSVGTNVQAVRLNGIPVYALSPTEQFFHIMIHGARWNAVAPLRWIPDALTVLGQAGTAIDWTKLMRDAREKNLSIAFQKTITYLHQTFNAPLPDEVIREMGKLKPSVSERLEFWMHNKPRGFARDALYLWFMHVRSFETKNIGKRLSSFPLFLRRFWKLPDDKSLVVFLASRWAKKMTKNKKEETLREKAF